MVRYYGGKSFIADQIVRILPPHYHYVEVFCGGARVFFLKKKAPVNTLNDIDHNLVSLYLCVRDRTDELIEKLYWMLNARKIFSIGKESLQRDDLSELDRAAYTYFLLETSFGAQGDNFATAVAQTSRRFRLKALDKLREVREFLDNTQVECLDFRECIEKYDSKGTLFYLDPPYVKGGFRYAHQFTEKDHEDLASLLKKIKGKFVLSYDSTEQIVRLYRGFNIKEIQAPLVVGNNKIGIDRSHRELLIFNFKEPLEQLDLFQQEEGNGIQSAGTPYG